MKKSKILLVLLLGIFVFQSCEKKTLTETENGIVKEEIVNADKNLSQQQSCYILNNQVISKDMIDFSNENLITVHGYDKNIYVFYSDDDLSGWAKKTRID